MEDLMRTAAQPTLYSAAGDTPVLSGVRCLSCGYVAFPPYTLGCERCGAAGDQLESVPLPAEGTTFSFATVHRQPRGDGAPYTILEILLDSGPLIRGLSASDNVAIGQRVRAAWRRREVDEAGNDIVEPVFVIAGGDAE
jgi:hypothetical protein